MSDNGKKTLSLKPKPALGADNAQATVRRPKKRIIRRSDIPAGKLTSSRKPKPKPAPRNNAKKPESKPLSPGDQKAIELTALLIERFPAWENYKPLALGVEKTLLTYLNENEIEASKRVVHRVLWHHTHQNQYLENILLDTHRYSLTGEEQQEIKDSEREHAKRVLKQQAEKQKKRR